MYERVFDPSLVAAEIVDVLRATTDCRLDICRGTASHVVNIIRNYIRDEDRLSSLCQALDNFEVDIHNCHDAQLLRHLTQELSDWFAEKAELSYSISQIDDQHIESLRVLASVVEKTDPLIPCNVLSENDMSFVRSLADLYLQDQSTPVRSAAISCLFSLAKVCSNVLVCLLETDLPSQLAQSVPRNGVLLEVEASALSLLDLLVERGENMPLRHFAYFDEDFMHSLLKLIPVSSSLILHLVCHLHSVLPAEYSEVVIETIVSNKNPDLGSSLIQFANKNASKACLGLLFHLVSLPPSVVDSLFFTNDLYVLVRIVSRELLDNEDQQIRLVCLKTLEPLLKMDISDHLVNEAVHNCVGVDEEIKDRVIGLLN